MKQPQVFNSNNAQFNTGLLKGSFTLRGGM